MQAAWRALLQGSYSLHSSVSQVRQAICSTAYNKLRSHMCVHVEWTHFSTLSNAIDYTPFCVL